MMRAVRAVGRQVEVARSGSWKEVGSGRAQVNAEVALEQYGALKKGRAGDGGEWGLDVVLKGAGTSFLSCALPRKWKSALGLLWLGESRIRAGRCDPKLPGGRRRSARQRRLGRRKDLFFSRSPGWCSGCCTSGQTVSLSSSSSSSLVECIWGERVFSFFLFFLPSEICARRGRCGICYPSLSLSLSPHTHLFTHTHTHTHKAVTVEGKRLMSGE